jgi:hypothetical protein
MNMLLPKSHYHLSGGRHRIDLAGGTISVQIVWTDVTTETEMIGAAEDMDLVMTQLADAIRAKKAGPVTVEGRES